MNREGNELVAVLSKLETPPVCPMPPGCRPLSRKRRNSKADSTCVRRSLLALIFLALFFSCVYLLPSMMCEEAERGILLAQALSPALPAEIMAAKFLFYPLVGIALAATLAGIAKPDVLLQPFFWLVLIVAAFGSLGIGLTIASIAKSQRTASMALSATCSSSPCFSSSVSKGTSPPSRTSRWNIIARMLHAALGDTVQWWHWFNLAAATALAIAWAVLATSLFRQRGWQ